MEKTELIWIASWAWGKGYNYEQVMYCDYLYGKEDEIDKVWKYYEEIEENGYKAFAEKYKHFKLY